MVITEKDILMATEVKIETLQLIYNVFKKYMIQELRFRSPAISLRAVASACGSNDKYLSMAIRSFSREKTFYRYLTHLRLKYACYLLVKNPNYKIDYIANQCGIPSRSTFYRIFKNEYGRVPESVRADFAGKEFTHLKFEEFDDEAFYGK